jgi:hypothetical protein
MAHSTPPNLNASTFFPEKQNTKKNEFFLLQGDSKCLWIEVDHFEYSQKISHPRGNHELE